MAVWPHRPLALIASLLILHYVAFYDVEQNGTAPGDVIAYRAVHHREQFMRGDGRGRGPLTL